MYTSEYWSKRVSWHEPPPQFPRLSIHSIIRSKTTGTHDVTSTPDVANHLLDKSSAVTTIPYPQSPTTKKHSKLRSYVNKITRPIICRFRPRAGLLMAPPPKVKKDAQPDDVPSIYSRFEMPESPPPLPASPISSTSPITDSAAMLQLEKDRAIRAEQDAAYERALKLDRERLEKLREERLKEEALERELAEQRERERIQKEKEALYRRTQNDWRRWARRALTLPTQDKEGLKFAVRLPSGRRHVDVLPADASLGALYTFVETLLIPSEFAPEDDPEEPPEGYVHTWEFRLVTTHERVILPNNLDMCLRGLDSLRRGVLLIVEELDGGELPDGEVEIEAE